MSLWAWHRRCWEVSCQTQTEESASSALWVNLGWPCDHLHLLISNQAAPSLKVCRTWLWMESFKITKHIPCCCTSTSQIGWVQITYYSLLMLGFLNSFPNYQTNSRLLCFLSWSGKIPALYTHVHALSLMQAFPWYWNNRNVVSVSDCNYHLCIAQDYNGRELHTENVSKFRNYGSDVIWIWLKKSEMLCGWHSSKGIGSNTPTIMRTV